MTTTVILAKRQVTPEGYFKITDDLVLPIFTDEIKYTDDGLYYGVNDSQIDYLWIDKDAIIQIKEVSIEALHKAIQSL
jgi:hypothetical protein